MQIDPGSQSVCVCLSVVPVPLSPRPHPPRGQSHGWLVAHRSRPAGPVTRVEGSPQNWARHRLLGPLATQHESPQQDLGAPTEGSGSWAEAA